MSSLDYVHYKTWKGWEARPFGRYSLEQALYYAAELDRSGVRDIAGKAVLELGFGNGEFAAWARDQRATYFGTEIIAELVAQAAEQGFSVHDGERDFDSFLETESVDLVVSFDMLEHLNNDLLLRTLRSVHRVLRSSGRLIARVPSGDSPFGRATQHGDSTHRMTIGSSMVKQLAKDTGFTVERIREPALPLSGLGYRTWMRRALLTGVRRVAYALVTQAFMGGGQPVLTPNMLFVLVKP